MKQYENKADFMKDVKDRFFHSMEYKYDNKKIDRNSWLCYTRKGFPVITYPYNEDQYDMFLDIFNMLDNGYDNGIYLNEEINYILTRIAGKFDQTDTRAIIDNTVTVGLLNRGYNPCGEARKVVFDRCHDVIKECLDESRKVNVTSANAKVIKINEKRVS